MIASSYSGGTEETLAPSSGRWPWAPRVVGLTRGSGGTRPSELAKAAAFDYDGQPRAAIGYSLLPLLGVLARLGYLPDQTAAVRVTGIEVVRESGGLRIRTAGATGRQPCRTPGSGAA